MTAKKKGTYRLTPGLDEKITIEAQELGISKNALIQQTLYKVFIEKQWPQIERPTSARQIKRGG